MSVDEEMVAAARGELEPLAQVRFEARIARSPEDRRLFELLRHGLTGARETQARLSDAELSAWSERIRAVDPRPAPSPWRWAWVAVPAVALALFFARGPSPSMPPAPRAEVSSDFDGAGSGRTWTLDHGRLALGPVRDWVTVAAPRFDVTVHALGAVTLRATDESLRVLAPVGSLVFVDGPDGRTPVEGGKEIRFGARSGRIEATGPSETPSFESGVDLDSDDPPALDATSRGFALNDGSLAGRTPEDPGPGASSSELGPEADGWGRRRANGATGGADPGVVSRNGRGRRGRSADGGRGRGLRGAGGRGTPAGQAEGPGATGSGGLEASGSAGRSGEGQGPAGGARAAGQASGRSGAKPPRHGDGGSRGRGGTGSAGGLAEASRRGGAGSLGPGGAGPARGRGLSRGASSGRRTGVASAPDPVLWFTRAEDLAEAGKVSEAERVLRTAIRNEMLSDHRSWFQLALARLWMSHRPGLGEKLLERLTRSAEREVRRQAEMARCEWMARRDGCRARRCLERLVEQDVALRPEIEAITRRMGDVACD